MHFSKNTIYIPDTKIEFIDSLIKSGKFKARDEVIQSALEYYKKLEMEYEALIEKLSELPLEKIETEWRCYYRIAYYLVGKITKI